MIELFSSLRNPALRLPNKTKPNCEARLLELVRENAALRHQQQFVSAIYQSIEQMTISLQSLRQQTIINYYIRPDHTGEADEEWLSLASELDRVCGHYFTAVKTAGAEYERMRKALSSTQQL